MLRSSLGTLLIGLVVLTACSSDDEPAAKYPSVDSFCQAKAEQECQVATSCAAKVETCTSGRKTLCLDAAGAAQSGPRTYAAKQAETCVNKTKELYAKKGTAITPDDVKKLNEVCDDVFAGARKEREPCTSSAECSGDLICDKTVCAKKVQKNKGDFCGNPGEVCATGSYCSQGSGGALQCIGKKDKGEACDEKAPCLEALRCNATCQDRFGSGETCNPAADECGTAAPYCDPSIGNKCGPGLIAAPGAAACGECKAGANKALCGFGS